MIEDRLRPVASIRTLLRGSPVERRERVITGEGELATVVDHAGGTLGVIVGDDFLTVIDGRTARVDQRARVRAAVVEVVVHLPLSLGTKRPRRFFFRPPAGWLGLARGLSSVWLAPGAPRDPATITVLPARPIDDTLTADTFFRDESFTDLALTEHTREPIRFSSLAGTVGRARAGARVFTTIALDDMRYMYVLRLATTPDLLVAGESALFTLAESCEPLPARRPEVAVEHALSYLVM